MNIVGPVVWGLGIHPSTDKKIFPLCCVEKVLHHGDEVLSRKPRCQSSSSILFRSSIYRFYGWRKSRSTLHLAGSSLVGNKNSRVLYIYIYISLNPLP